MRIVRNLQENIKGFLQCQVLIDRNWFDSVITKETEYELHESSEWKDIKPCPQSEKDAYAIKQAREQFKIDRASAVNAITITTIAGNVFDGDEISQTRMARAIAVLDDGESTPWVLTDNTAIMATKEELKEALKLAGMAQSELWVMS